MKGKDLHSAMNTNVGNPKCKDCGTDWHIGHECKGAKLMDRREKILDIINKEQLQCLQAQSCTPATMIADQIEALLPQWIPVSERLPEKPMPCLVYMADRDSVMLTNYNGDFTLIRVGYETGFSAHGVTHWQPLPQPPKEGE